MSKTKVIPISEFNDNSQKYNLLKKLNNKYLEYDIKKDNSLGNSIMKFSNSKMYLDYQSHHIIPAGFEAIPNITIFWTIQFIKNNNKNIKNIGYKIKENKIFCHSGGTLMLNINIHADLHKFLDKQKDAFFDLYGLTSIKNNIFKIPEKYKDYIADRKKYQVGLDSYHFINMKNNRNLSKSKLTRKELREKYKQDYNNLKNGVINYVSSNNINENVNFNKIVGFFNENNINLEEMNSIIRNSYISENAKIKRMFSNGIRQITLNDFLSYFNTNVFKETTENVNNIFETGFLNSLKKITIFIDSDKNIISGLPLLLYLYKNNMYDIKFNICPLNEQDSKKYYKNLG